MSKLLYVIPADPWQGEEITAMLRSAGMAPRSARVTGCGATGVAATGDEGQFDAVPVGEMAASTLLGALVGALIGTPLLHFGSIGFAPLTVLVIIGGLSGAMLVLWLRSPLPPEQSEAVAFEVHPRQVSEWTRRLESRYPGVRVIEPPSMDGAARTGTVPATGQAAGRRWSWQRNGR